MKSEHDEEVEMSSSPNPEGKKAKDKKSVINDKATVPAKRKGRQSTTKVKAENTDSEAEPEVKAKGKTKSRKKAEVKSEDFDEEGESSTEHGGLKPDVMEAVDGTADSLASDLPPTNGRRRKDFKGASKRGAPSKAPKAKVGLLYLGSS